MSIIYSEYCLERGMSFSMFVGKARIRSTKIHRVRTRGYSETLWFPERIIYWERSQASQSPNITFLVCGLILQVTSSNMIRLFSIFSAVWIESLGAILSASSRSLRKLVVAPGCNMYRKDYRSSPFYRQLMRKVAKHSRSLGILKKLHFL